MEEDRFESVQRPDKVISTVNTHLIQIDRRGDKKRQGLNKTRRLGTIQYWWFELLCAVVSLLAIVAIVALLRSFDGKPLIEWNVHVAIGDSLLPISPNFVVSVLSTLSKSAFAVAVSASLSQAKWNWFAVRSAPLNLYQTFDSASRGPMGSFVLLWETKARRLASVGAFITIIAIAFDPFTQLLISYPGIVRQAEDVRVTIPGAIDFNQGERSEALNNFYNGVGLISTSPAGAVVAAVNNGLWSSTNRLQPRYTCDRGNCTWPPYVSLSVCSSCYDVSDKLNISLSTTVFPAEPGVTDYKMLNVTLAPFIDISMYNSRSFFNGAIGQDTVMASTSIPNNTINFKESQTLLLSLAMIRADPSYFANQTRWNMTRMVAQECGLTVCTATYNASVSNGRYQSTVLETYSAKAPDSWAAQVYKITLSNGTVVYSGRPIPGYNSTRNFNRSLSKRLVRDYGFGPMFLGSPSWNPLYLGDPYGPRRTDFELELSAAQQQLVSSSPKLQKPPTFRLTQAAVDSAGAFLASVMSNGTVSKTNQTRIFSSETMRALYLASSLEQVFSNVAHDMSSALANLVVDTDVNNDNPSSETVSPTVSTAGSTFEYTVVLSVRWPFVILPVLSSVLSLLFLVATIVQTRTHMKKDTSVVRPWKDDALAGLVYGLSNETRTRARRKTVMVSVNERNKRSSRTMSKLKEAGKVKVKLERSYGGDGPELGLVSG